MVIIQNHNLLIWTLNQFAVLGTVSLEENCCLLSQISFTYGYLLHHQKPKSVAADNGRDASEMDIRIHTAAAPSMNTIQNPARRIIWSLSLSGCSLLLSLIFLCRSCSLSLPTSVHILAHKNAHAIANKSKPPQLLLHKGRSSHKKKFSSSSSSSSSYSSSSSSSAILYFRFLLQRLWKVATQKKKMILFSTCDFLIAPPHSLLWSCSSWKESKQDPSGSQSHPRAAMGELQLLLLLLRCGAYTWATARQLAPNPNQAEQYLHITVGSLPWPDD